MLKGVLDRIQLVQEKVELFLKLESVVQRRVRGSPDLHSLVSDDTEVLFGQELFS